jgi:hypothetical protein
VEDFVDAPSVARTPLVGRERELALLDERLAAVGRGEGRLVLVAGEPGIGKTRLLAELAERAARGGWRVLQGRAYEPEGMQPYLPFAEARSSSRRMPSALPRSSAAPDQFSRPRSIDEPVYSGPVSADGAVPSAGQRRRAGGGRPVCTAGRAA